MDLEQLKKDLADSFDQSIEKKLKEVMKSEARDQVAGRISDVVKALRVQRFMTGRDSSGLSDEQKLKLCDSFMRAQKAMTIESPEKGGVTVDPEVYAGILRVAETFGYVAAMAQKIPMNGTAEVTVPKYTGSNSQWEYLNENTAGSATNYTIGNALLRLKKASRIVVFDNSLLKRATVNFADWIMAILAESLAYTLDYQGFVGTGAPFTGILNDTAISTVTMATGDTDFTDFDVDYASEMIANLRKEARNGAAFFMHSTVWHLLRTQKDSQGRYQFAQDNNFMKNNEVAGLQPDGAILGYPVFCVDVLPDSGDTAVSTKFVIFGNLRYMAFGDGGSMEITKSEHATIGGVSAFAAYQSAFRGLHEHALVVGNEQGFVKLSTAAS